MIKYLKSILDYNIGRLTDKGMVKRKDNPFNPIHIKSSADQN